MLWHKNASKGWFWWKKPTKGTFETHESPTFKFVTTSFFTWKPNLLGLETAVCQIFVKPVLDIFGARWLVPSMNLSHMQHCHLCLNNQNYLLEKTDSSFFLNYRLRTTIKITNFSTFYVTDNFSSCYSWNSCKKPHACEEGEAHLRISFWHLLRNLKNK